MSAGRILCCLCGTSIEVNDAAMCVPCLLLQAGPPKGLDKWTENNEIVHCNKCGRWQVRKDVWVHHERESPQLLAMMLRKIPSLQKQSKEDIKVIEANFIWTEPHSKRQIISIDIERSLLDDKVRVRQKVEVQFLERYKQCHDCIREAGEHRWGAVIQVRQFVGHKKTFFLLENRLTQAKLTDLMLDIQIVKDGMDIYFTSKNKADRVLEFITSQLPCKMKQSKKLVSTDRSSNVGKHEYTTLVEILPICRGDLVVTPKSLTGACDLMLVAQLSSSLHLVNPTTCTQCEMTTSQFSSTPLVPLLTTRNLTSFVVLSCTLMDNTSAIESTMQKESARTNPGVKHKMAKNHLAEVVLVRETDLGSNDDSHTVLTHLGSILEAGDTCVGYDLQHAVLSLQGDTEIQRLSFEVPNIVIVAKSYPSEEKTKKNRKKSSDSSVFSHRSPERNKGTRRGGGANGDGLSIEEKEFEQFRFEESQFEEMTKALGEATIATGNTKEHADYQDVNDDDNLKNLKVENIEEWVETEGDEAGEDVEG